MLFAVTLCVAIAGCGGDPAKRATPPASEGVKELAAALRSDDPAPAYRLLSRDMQRQLDYEEFALQWKQHASERNARAASLEEELQSESSLGEKARLTYPDGKTVYLSREDERWRVDAAMVSRNHAGRPHDAIAIFAQAMFERDYDVIMGVLTERRRTGISRQVDSFVQSLQERLASPDNVVELIGEDRAEMRWDDGRKRYKLILRKEGDQWRIDDVQLQPTPMEPEDE